MRPIHFELPALNTTPATNAAMRKNAPPIRALLKYHWLTVIWSRRKTPAPIFLSQISFSRINPRKVPESFIFFICFFASFSGVVPRVRYMIPWTRLKRTAKRRNAKNITTFSPPLLIRAKHLHTDHEIKKACKKQDNLSCQVSCKDTLHIDSKPCPDYPHDDGCRNRDHDQGKL